MTDNDEETLWMQGSPLNDVDGDLEATPCPVPVRRVEPRSFGVDSLNGRDDTRSPALPDTLSMTSSGSPARVVLPAPVSPTPRVALPAPDSPAHDIDQLIEQDIQLRHEERALQLMDECAAIQIVEEDECAARKRLQDSINAYEQASGDEETVSRSLSSEDDCRPQVLYCVQRARLFNKRRSNYKHQHEYPAKRGGDSSDALVVVKYPDAEFTVRRFGYQEMEARHGNLSEFRRAWLDDYHADQRGYHGDGEAMFGIDMYYVDHIYRAQFPVVYEELYYADLFFRSKFYETFGKRRSYTGPKPLYIAWCNFVNKYAGTNSRDPNAYEKSLQDREERFYRLSVPGVAMKIHEASIKIRMPCTVPVDVECPSCYGVSGRAVIGAHPPSSLAVLHARLQDLLKQKRTKTPASIEHEAIDRLEDEVTKLRADIIKLQQYQNNSSNESSERVASCEGLEESLQRNIAAEVAAQLSQHFRSMASNVMSNNSSS
ncbi:hypothetical protein FI667_g16911, partial [Globisporangium splendens]